MILFWLDVIFFGLVGCDTFWLDVILFWLDVILFWLDVNVFNIFNISGLWS